MSNFNEVISNQFCRIPSDQHDVRGGDNLSFPGTKNVTLLKIYPNNSFFNENMINDFHPKFDQSLPVFKSIIISEIFK